MQEIESTPFHIGEDLELEETYHRFTNAKKLEEHACCAYDLLSGKDQSVSDLIGLAYRELQSVASLDEGGKDLLEQIQNLEDLVNGLNMDLSNYRSSLLFDEVKFQEVEPFSSGWSTIPSWTGKRTGGASWSTFMRRGRKWVRN